MGEVVQLKGDDVVRHLSGRALCLACKHEWVAVSEASKDSYEGDLECPKCGVCRGQYKWPFQGPPAELVWTCPCDGTLFMLTLQGTRCVGCGRHQVFK